MREIHQGAIIGLSVRKVVNMNYVVTNIAKLTNIFKEIRSEIEKGNTSINLSWEKTHRAKTLAQLGFFWGGLVKSINNHFKEYYGKEYEADTIKEMLYNECSVTEEFVCPNGKVLYQTKRLSRMTVEEASEFITKVVDFCDEYGIVLQPELKYLWIYNLNPRDVDDIENMKFPDRDEEYLRYVRSETCLICGKGGCEAHHAKLPELAGLGEKTPDYMAISLCKNCHRNYNGGHITTEEIIRCVPFIFKKFTLKQFCKLKYYRYIKHQ